MRPPKTRNAATSDDPGIDGARPHVTKTETDMNTASTTSSLPRPGPFTKGEIEIHREFARKCVRAKQFEDLSSRYMAMKAECHRRGLRACSFQEFRNAIRLNRLDAVRRRNLVKAWPAATEYYFGPPTASALLHEHGSLSSLWRGR